jgi:diacylglycerol kinase family enzyme
MTSGQSKDPPTLACRDAFREVSIQADKRLPIQADGEIIGSTPISIKLVPAAINFLLPDDSAK